MDNTQLLDRPTDMAKSRRPERQPEKKPDQHASDFMIRLPEEYRSVLQKIQKSQGTPMTVTVQMALEMFFRARGISFTPNWPEAL